MRIRNLLLGILTAILVSFGITRNEVNADMFYPNGDAKDCDFLFATGITYSNLPNNCNVPLCLSYNHLNVSGNKTEEISTRNITDLVNIYYPAYRKSNVFSSVSAPPNTQIDISFYSYNHTGHNVFVDSIDFYTSISNLSSDWKNLGLESDYSSTNFLYFGETRNRVGNLINLKSIGSIPSHNINNLPTGRVIYSFKLIQPLIIKSRNLSYYYENKNLVIIDKISIQNVSTYYLPNIQINHPLGQSKIINIQPNNESTMEFKINMDEIYDLIIDIGEIEVIDPNYHTEKNSLSSNIISDRDPNMRDTFIYRNDSNSPIGWNKSQPSFVPYPQNDSYNSITLLPYNIYSDENSIIIKENIDFRVYVSDDDEFKVKNNQIINNNLMKYELYVKNNGGYIPNLKLDWNNNFDNLILINSTCEINDSNIIINNLKHGDIFECEIIVKPIINVDNVINSNSEFILSYIDKSITQTINTQIISNLLPQINILVTDNDEIKVSQNIINLNNEKEYYYEINVKNNSNIDLKNIEVYLELEEITNNNLEILNGNDILNIDHIYNLQAFSDKSYDIKVRNDLNISTLPNFTKTCYIIYKNNRISCNEVQTKFSYEEIIDNNDVILEDNLTQSGLYLTGLLSINFIYLIGYLCAKLLKNLQ